jgi:hypothetical protein
MKHIYKKEIKQINIFLDFFDERRKQTKCNKTRIKLGGLETYLG